jgi:hypothetical protein
MSKMRFFMPIGFLAVVAGGSAVVMLLWNWLLPTIFGLSVISFWQALGILVLCRLLFGSFGKMRFGRMGHGMHGKNPIHEKWLKMTSEERKDFIRKKREHIAKCDFSGLANHVFGADENMSKKDE